MKIIKTIFLKILPVVLIFILAIVAFGFVGEKLGLMSMDDFLSRVEENAKEILKIEDEVEQESEVVDDRPLNISVDTKERRILESTTTITVKSNKKIKIQESERYNLIEISAEPYLYALEIKNIGVGEAVLTLDFLMKQAMSNNLTYL